MKTIHIECANEISPNELRYISDIFGELGYEPTAKKEQEFKNGDK